MTGIQVRVVDVYVYRDSAAQGIEFLLLRRAKGVTYAGAWRMVGGKMQERETAWATALREVEEETGHPPLRLWNIPSMNAFYEWQQDRVNLIPAFAAQLDADPQVNHEHDAYAWLPTNEAVQRLEWPEQQRLLLLAERMLMEGIPAALEIPI